MVFGVKFLLINLNVIFKQCMTPAITGQEAAPEKLDYVLSEFRDIMTQFEEKFLQERPFLAGDEISLADLVAIVEIMQVITWFSR